ncbi:MAG: cytochrome c oxidase subunit [Pseudonocardiales bacterium]|nr:cytochrome c oxidase subunit [Pseudonocardiales bacterium]
MATASATQSAPLHASLNRPNLVSVGTIVWLSSELMFFASLFGMYFTVRSVTGQPWPPAGVTIDIPYSGVFTTILVLSSVTCQLGVFAAERGDVKRLRIWYVITFVMGLIFILGQGNEYFKLNDFTPKTNAFGSVFYITTGFHGLHVLGGLIAFVLLLARTMVGKFTPEKATSAIVVSYYWHFVDVVWIGLYSTIYLIQ